MRTGQRIRWRLFAGFCVPFATGCVAHRDLPADAPQVRAAAPAPVDPRTPGIVPTAAVLQLPTADAAQPKTGAQPKNPEPGKSPEPPKSAEPPKKTEAPKGP